MGKKRIISVGVAVFLIIVIGVVDWLAPQSPVLSLSEGIFEAAQIVLVLIATGISLFPGGK